MKTTLRLLTLALTLLGTGASASTFYGYRAPLPNVTITAPDNLLGFKVTVTTAGALQAFGANFRAASGNGSMGLYLADGANGDPGTLLAQTGSFAIDAAGTLELPPTASVTLAVGDYWIMGVFSQNAYPGYDYSAAKVIKYRALPFSATLPGTCGATTPYTGGKFNYYIKVAGSIHAVLFARGAKVPGAGDPGSGIPADAEFTDFGSPAINALGDVAVRATYSLTGGADATTVRTLTITLDEDVTVLAKEGDTVGSGPGGGGVVIKKLGDAIGISDAGNVLFTATVTPQSGQGAPSVLVGLVGLHIITKTVAQTGVAVNTASGGVWKTINKMALTPDGRVLIEGNLAPLRGVVTGKNNHVLYATNGAGGLDVLLQAGRFVLSGGTLTPGGPMRTFEGLQGVRGWTGVTSAFNDRQMVFTVTFQGALAGTDLLGRAKPAVVLVDLP